MPTALANQSLMNSSRVLRKTSAAGSAPHPSVLGGGNSSKGEQNSNSLAGASFPTFCALMSAIAGIIFAAGKHQHLVLSRICCSLDYNSFFCNQ